MIDSPHFFFFRESTACLLPPCYIAFLSLLCIVTITYSFFLNQNFQNRTNDRTYSFVSFLFFPFHLFLWLFILFCFFSFLRDWMCQNNRKIPSARLLLFFTCERFALMHSCSLRSSPLFFYIFV